MENDPSDQRRRQAADEFNRREHRDDGAHVVDGLEAGLDLVRDQLYARVHADVERLIGRDSMLMPVSAKKGETETKREIDLFQTAVSAATAGEYGYVAAGADWYLGWLAALRLGESSDDPGTLKRLAGYLSLSPDGRRLAFSDALARVLPESGQSPLVLFRLVGPAVGIVTALAFSDRATATGLRQRQTVELPSVAGCPQCRGKLLESGQQCPVCGNPLWKYRWLIEAD